MPARPIVSVFVPAPDWITTLPLLAKLRPAADWAASKLTVCAEVTVLMLNCAKSDAPGGAVGSGIAASGSVDQELATFQLVPVPSQERMAADPEPANEEQTDNVRTTMNGLLAESQLMVLSPWCRSVTIAPIDILSTIQGTYKEIMASRVSKLIGQ
jgi:hypothetical protein